jgi:hypothetical protein
MLFDDNLIEVQGLSFRIDVEPDVDSGPPWKECDGHGPVSEWRSKGWRFHRPKRAGERILCCSDHGSYRTYDMAEANRIARHDGWGLSDKPLAELTRRLGRVPTRGEIRAEAVERDFDFLRRWCADDWHYVGVNVTLMIEDEDGELAEYDGPMRSRFHDALWGVEDSSGGVYVREVAQEMAGHIASLYRKEQAETLAWAERDVMTEES